jgi:hypothetical protein
MRYLHTLITVSLLVGVVAVGSQISTSLLAQRSASPAIAITGVRLIDGTGAAARDGMTVVVEGDRIAAIGADVRIPPGAQIFDGAGKTLLPGLIDTHVHFRDWVPELFLANGVTTVRDAGNPPEWILPLKKKEAAGEMRGPRIFAVGNIIDAPPAERGHHIAVATPEEARAATRQLFAAGVDGIKVYEKMTPALVRPVAEVAHAAGRRVIGHITFSARDGALAGLDALEHASGIAIAIARDPALVAQIKDHEGVFGWRFMDPAKADDLIRLLVERRVAVVPALASWARGSALRRQFQTEASRMIADPELAYLTDEAKGRVKNYDRTRPDGEVRDLAAEYDGLKQFLTRFHRAGGRVAVGTDGGAMWGLSVHHEMQLMVDMGLSPLEAIKTATGGAAELIQANDLGTIRAGNAADLVLVNGNPLESIEATKNIVTVIQRGRVIDTRYHRDYRIPIPRPPIRGSGL